MGIIKVKGSARKEVVADKMNINITLRSKERTTARALKTVREQCESLLELLKEAGLDISNIIIDEDSIGETSRYSSEETYMIGRKKLEIELKADVKAANALTGIIQQSNYDIEYKVGYFVEDVATVHRYLMKDAVLDSKEKATVMAEALGEVVVGAKEIRDDDDYGYSAAGEEYDCLEVPRFLTRKKSKTPLSDMLSAPKKEFLEEIYVEWITE